MQLNWQEEQAKADRLELLYQRSGRTHRDHELHGRFTGLAATAPSASEAVLTAHPTPASPRPNGADPSCGTRGKLPTESES